MPAYPEHPSDHASSTPQTDPATKQPSTVGSSSTAHPPHPSRNTKLRDSLDIEPVDVGEKEIWRNVRQELRQMLDDAREHLESMIKAHPNREAALRKEHEEETVLNCRKMAHEHYLEELAHEREERLWLSGQKPSPSLVKQQHGIMNRIQSSTGGATSSSSSASTSSASSSTSTVHNGDTRTKVSSSPTDTPESRHRNDSRSSMSRPLPSFTQQPYHIPPLPPQLEAARRTSHGSGGASHRDEVLGDAAGHDAPWGRHGAFDDEFRRPPSTSTSSLRSKASINEFPAVVGPNGTSPTKASIFEHPRTVSDRHHATSPPGNKPVDELWTPHLSPEEEAAAVAVRQHYSMDRRSSDASLRSMSSVASGRHPPSEAMSARVDKAKDREYHERKAKDYYPTSNRSPSSGSPAPVSSSYPKPRVFDDPGVRERDFSDSPHISSQYPSRSHQGSMDDWPQYPPSTSRKSSRHDPYDPYPYPSQPPYQEPAVRPTVMRSGSYSRPYPNYDMVDDPPSRTYASHSQSIPVPHRSPNPATMASSVDQPESFSGQSPGWRDWKSHQSPIPEDYTGGSSSYKSSSRNSFETRYNYKMADEPSEQPDHPGWRRRNETWFREVSAREMEAKRLEEDMKKKENELIGERAELRMKEERIAEREAAILAREQKISRKFIELEEREKMTKEESDRAMKAAKSHEEGARQKSEETQKLKEQAHSMKEEARRLKEEANKSMEEAKAKESEVVDREEVVKNLEISTKELHARVEQTEKSLEAREKDLKEKDQALKKKEEDMKRREEDFKKRVTDVKKKDLALSHRSDDISNRERAIGNRENEVKRKEEDLANREQDIRNRERDAEMSKYDLEDRASSVVEREREVEMRDNSLLQLRKELEADREELNKKWSELQKREHELSNKMKQKLEDEPSKEDEMEREREKREEEEDRERREGLEREEQRMREQARIQKERKLQEEQKAREERRQRVEEEERQRASEEQRIREEVMKGRARRQEENQRRQEGKERRQEEKEWRQWGVGDEERAKEEEMKRRQELREAREKEERERDERFKQEQERMRQQMENQQREARQRRDSSGPDNFWSSSSASGGNRVPPTRANSTTIPDTRGNSSGPPGWGTAAGSSGWGSSSGTSTGSSGWSSSGTSAGSSGWGPSTGPSAWSSTKASSASSTASSNRTQRKPSTNFGTHSSTSTSGTEKPKSIEEQNQATREKFRLQQERDETLRQAKLASAGKSTGDMMQAYILHENQWETLPKHDLLHWDSFPWPMFNLPTNAEQITAGAIWAYLKQDVYLTKDKSTNIKDRIKDQIKKWHPDRFETKLLPKVVEDQREMVKEGAGNVARCLNDLLEKAPSLMG